nr:hypothetical protein CFP56_23631 [Quercus suber]
MEWCARTTEKALELAEHKATEALHRLREAKLKLAETTSILTARDKEFIDYKGGVGARKQHYYNKGFQNAEDLVGPVILQAQKFGFLEGWMTAVNAIGLPEESPFRKIDQVPLLEDLAIGAQTEG